MSQKVRIVNGDGRVKFVTSLVARDSKAMRDHGFRIEELKDTTVESGEKTNKSSKNTNKE